MLDLSTCRPPLCTHCARIVPHFTNTDRVAHKFGTTCYFCLLFVSYHAT